LIIASFCQTSWSARIWIWRGLSSRVISYSRSPVRASPSQKVAPDASIRSTKLFAWVIRDL
jgi:hypothetical protein